MEPDFKQILGIRFYVGAPEGLLRLVLRGGLFVVPSGPGLATLDQDVPYREALERSDVALTDSGFLVLLWLLRRGELVGRISGLRLLRALLAVSEFRERGRTFWIMPSEADAAANLAWLNSQGIPVESADTYIAPNYPGGRLADPALVAVLAARRPRFVMVNIGGGVQEKLGLHLRESLDYTPAIICTGAAIAFLSGQQARIPVWADRMMLGWLFRCVSAPGRFIPRYVRTLRLVSLVFRYGPQPVRGRDGAVLGA